jgi:hypothetical protein
MVEHQGTGKNSKCWGNIALPACLLDCPPPLFVSALLFVVLAFLTYVFGFISFSRCVFVVMGVLRVLCVLLFGWHIQFCCCFVCLIYYAFAHVICIFVHGEPCIA